MKKSEGGRIAEMRARKEGWTAGGGGVSGEVGAVAGFGEELEAESANQFPSFEARPCKAGPMAPAIMPPVEAEAAVTSSAAAARFASIRGSSCLAINAYKNHGCATRSNTVRKTTPTRISRKMARSATER